MCFCPTKEPCLAHHCSRRKANVTRARETSLISFLLTLSLLTIESFTQTHQGLIQGKLETPRQTMYDGM